jgi:hypothetical protein
LRVFFVDNLFPLSLNRLSRISFFSREKKMRASSSSYSILARPPVKWAHVGERILKREAKKKSDAFKRQKVYRKNEYAQLESYKEMSNSGRKKLESLETAFRYFFDHSETKLGYMQAKLKEVVIMAFLKNMFGDDLVPNLKYLSKKFEITKFIDTVAIMFPRRSGKTMGCAIIIAALVRRHMEVYRESTEFGWQIVSVDVRRKIIIKTNKFGTINSIKSYACALRGDGKIDSIKKKKTKKESQVCSFHLFFKRLFELVTTNDDLFSYKSTIFFDVPSKSINGIVFRDSECV